MKAIRWTTRFKKDVKLASRRGKDLQKLETITLALISEKPLEPKHKDHFLKGNYKNRRECHIEPDWLLIYKVERDYILFERTGTHTDLFD